MKCFEITAKMLAIGMANAVAVTSPEKIFLFGGLIKAGDLLMTPLKKYFEDISAIEVPELKSKNSNEIISTIKSFMAYINNQINLLWKTTINIL